MATRLIVYRVKDRPPINATTAKGLLLNLFSLNVLQKVSSDCYKLMRHSRSCLSSSSSGPFAPLSLSLYLSYILRRYLTQRYALKAYRHVRATGVISVLSCFYTSVLSTFYAYLLRYVPSLRKKVSRELAIARKYGVADFKTGCAVSLYLVTVTCRIN